MTMRARATIGTALLVLFAGARSALADEPVDTTPQPSEAIPPAAQPAPSYLPPPPPPPAPGTASTAAAATAPAPAAPPPAPAPAPSPPVVTSVPPASSVGQWAYTQQYGWVFMPYDSVYTSVNPAADSAYMYVYYPSYGWRWLWSPWVLGWGVRPYWGVWGPHRFVWYSHPWFHAGYGYRGYHYAVRGRAAPAYHYRPHYSGHGRRR